MKPTIEHIALWTSQLETLRDFYVTQLGGTAGNLYHNPQTNFRSYFVQFGTGTRLELMERPEVSAASGSADPVVGWAHIALTIGGKETVDTLTNTLRSAGVRIASEPRWTGDGYYESVILDPDGNRVELTVEKEAAPPAAGEGSTAAQIVKSVAHSAAASHAGSEFTDLLERARNVPPKELWDFLSHDVKGMLAVIQGSLDLLRTSETGFSVEDHQLMDLIARSADRAILIVDAYTETYAPPPEE